MASLIGWLKRGANIVNNDVLRPIQRDIVRPTANVASRTFDQVNPLDSGRSFGNRTPQVNTPVVPTAYNFGRGLVTGTGIPSLINADITNPLKESLAILTHNRQAQANASSFYRQPIGQQLEKLGGNAAGALLTVAAPGISSGVEHGLTYGAGVVAPRLAERLLAEQAARTALGVGGEATSKALSALLKYGGGAVAGSAIGAPFNVASLAQQGAPLTKQNIKKAAIQGAEFGGALGVGIPLAEAGVKSTVRGVRLAANQATPLNQVGAVGKNVNGPKGVPKLTDKQILKGFADVRKQFPNDKAFYDQFIAKEAYKNTRSADLAMEIMGQVENDNIPHTQAINNSILPDNSAPPSAYHSARSELVRIASVNKQPQLLKQFDQISKGMSETEKTALLNKSLNDFRNKGGLLAERGAKFDSTRVERFGLAAPKTSYRGVSPDEWASVEKGNNFSGKNTKLISMTEDASKAHEYSKGGLVVEFKPEARLKGGKNTEHMGSTEFRAKGLNKNDVARVTDSNGKVIYQDIAKSPALPSGSPAKRLTPDNVPIKTAGKGSVNLNKEAFTKADIAKLNKLNAVDQAKSSGRITKQPALNALTQGVKERLNPNPPRVPVSKENAKLNPQLGTVDRPKVLIGDSAQAHLNADFVAKHEKRVGDSALRELSKLSQKDQSLMKDIQKTGVESNISKAQNPAQFKNTIDAIRNYYDLRHAYDHSLGIQTPYRKNYLRDLIERNPTDQQFAVKGGNLTPGYTRAKVAPGRTNVAEALQRDIAGASFNHAKLTYAKGLEEAFPNGISRGSPIVGKEGVTQQLLTPYGNELFATKDIAKGINARASAATATGALGKYDTVNAFIKYVKLGGGAFHALTEAGNFIGQQLTSGKLFKEPGSTAKVFKTFFSDKALRSEVARLRKNGTMDKAQLSGLTWSPGDIKADVKITPTGRLAKYTGIKALHDATFGREIPYQKLKTFEQRTQGLDINNPADIAKMRTVAKAVNAEFGGINRMVEGITPQNAKRWSRILLASDFTESKVTTLRNAVIKGGEEGKLARQVIAGKVMLFGSLAVAGGAIGGELNGKNDSDKILTIVGKILDPTFNFGSYKVSLPATHVSEFTKPFKSFAPGSKDKFSGIKHYATARLAAVPSEINQLINNQDYRGQKIYGGTKAKPISGGKAALNVASGVIPIPGSQGISAATGQQSIPSAIANVIGLRSYQPTVPKIDKTNTGNSTLAQVKAGTKAGDYGLQKLDNGKYAYTINGKVHSTDKLQAAKLALAKDSFGQSNRNYQVIGNKVLRKNSDGSVSTTNKSVFDMELGTAQLTQYKKSGDLNSWLKTANTQLGRISTQLKDPSTDPLEKISLQNKAQILADNIAKYSGYGGFKKYGRGSRKLGSRARPSLTSFKTSTKTKIAKPKGIKVKKVAGGTFKAPKTRKLSVSKIPSNYLSKKLYA